MECEINKFATIQQGVPRGQQGPLEGCGVSPPIIPFPSPEAAQEKKDMISNKNL
jgi:hypothetical protein